MRLSLALSLMLLAACGGDAPANDSGSSDALPCGAPYAPFDAANYENQFLRVGAYEQIVALRKGDSFSAADFDAIEALYTDTAELQGKVQGRTDDHSYTTDPAVGATLDGLITAAIAAGKADESIAVQGQIIDKTLQRFFYLSVFHEGMKAADDANALEDMQIGWDEGFGYFGISNDGTTTEGIAATLQKRDDEFGLSLVDTAYNGLLDGRCGLAGDDTAAALDALASVDLAIVQGFALSVVHEMDEYADDPLIKGWEGKLYWDAVADYALSADAANHAVAAEAFAGDLEAIDAPTVRAAVIDAFGLAL